MIIERMNFLADKPRAGLGSQIQIENRGSPVSRSDYVPGLWSRFSVEKKLFYVLGLTCFIIGIVGILIPFASQGGALIVGVLLLLFGRDISLTQFDLGQKYGL